MDLFNISRFYKTAQFSARFVWYLDNPKRDQVVNFMAFCVTNVVFMDLFDVSRFYKTAQLSLNIMARAVSTIGAETIVQVVTYNEAASKKKKAKYPHLV